MTDDAEDPRDSLDFTPEMMLEDMLKDVRTKHREDPPTKALVILLWDDGRQYYTQFGNAGMKVSEAVSLCEVMKQRFLDMILGKE